MSRLRNFWAPAYLFQPWQIPRRVACEYWFRPKKTETVILPWGLAIEIDPREDLGRALWAQGVYDVAATEACWRLLEPGELAVDAGANTGYMTSLLAARAGAEGCVVCFEPHPVVAASLRRNVERWSEQPDVARIEVHESALTSRSGTAWLNIPERFGESFGIAFIGEKDDQPVKDRFEVRGVCLDDALAPPRGVGLLKADVEGHELEMFRGASQLLKSKRIRDIVYEDYGPYPSDSQTLLESFGYTIFNIEERILGMTPIRAGLPYRKNSMQPPNCIATTDTARVERVFNRMGWRSFGFGRYLRGE